jgi:Phosphate-induced protein 1 conserved region
MRASAVVAAIAGLALVAVAAAPGAGAAPSETARPSAAHRVAEVVSTPVRGGSGTGVPPAARTLGSKSSNGISYHGGPVLNTGANAYVIWYGNWTGNSATTILPTLLTGLSGSPYYNINTTYYDGSKRIVPNSVRLAGQTTDAYSQGSANLSDGQINAIVSSAISSGRLPGDSTGVYFVLTSVDVTKSGFLTSYCGWHTHGAIGGVDIKYSFVGNPGSNSACSVQTSVSPNGNPGADAMASVIAHELEEAATDPNLNAWYDVRGYENADKCAWTFGTSYTVSNGSKANMSLGGLDFLIQRNWVNASGGYCSLSY